MQISTDHRVRAQPDVVFQRLIDVEAIAGMLAAAGVTLTRTDGGGPVSHQTELHADATIQGVARRIVCQVAEISPNDRIVVRATSSGIMADLIATLSADAETTTVRVQSDLSGTSIPGRLMLKAASLATPKITAKQQALIDGYLQGCAQS